MFMNSSVDHITICSKCNHSYRVDSPDETLCKWCRTKRNKIARAKQREYTSLTVAITCVECNSLIITHDARKLYCVDCEKRQARHKQLHDLAKSKW